MDERPESREVFRGKLISVRVETLPQPVGGTRDFEIVEHPDAVAVVAVRPAANGMPEVALVRQQRPAVARELWEIPAGLVDRVEERDERETAVRELREEIGYQAVRWTRLTRELPSPGYSNEAISIFLAEDLHPAGTAPGRSEDPTEIEAVRWLPLSKAVRLGETGEIEDGKTALGLMLAAARLGVLAGEEASEMPMDVTSVPFARRAPYRTAEAERAQAGSDSESSLKLDNMLLEEFNYISVTAYQAMEDRARMFNLYLILIGVVASAIGAVSQIGKQLGGNEAIIQPLLVVLLAVGAFLGTVFFVMLIHLRQAWRSSAIAMATIKEFYINRFKDAVPDVETAFAWRLQTIPKSERFGSTNFLVSYTVAFLGSLCAAGAGGEIYATWLAQVVGTHVPVAFDLQPWLVGAVVTLIYLLFHVAYFRRALNPQKEQGQIISAEKNVGGAE